MIGVPMKLSVVIPAKNEQALLPGLLEALRRQTFRDFEIIVADAKSTDRTREIAESFGARVVEGGMPGPGRNRGAEAAQGELVLFFDADVIPPSDRFLEDTVAEFERRHLDIAAFSMYPLSERRDDQALHYIYNAFLVAAQHVKPHGAGACLLVRGEMHRDVGGFDERVVYCEDHDYVQRLARAGGNYGILKSHGVFTSVRRLEKEGRLGLVLKYLYSEAHLLLRGPFNEFPFEYDMGGSAKDEKESVSR